jgi:phospholipid-transporting ATPase
MKQASGLDSGLWFWGTSLYLTVLLTVLGKAALISEYVVAPLVQFNGVCSLTMQHLDQVYGCWYAISSSFLANVKLICYTFIAIPGSFVFTMLFLPLYAVVAPAIGFSTEYYGLVPRLWTDAVFYLVLLLVPIFCLSRDYAWK